MTTFDYNYQNSFFFVSLFKFVNPAERIIALICTNKQKNLKNSGSCNEMM